MKLCHLGLLFVWLVAGLGYAQPELRYRAHLAMTLEALDLKAPVTVDFTIEGAEEGSCLYVPAQDQKLRRVLLLESIKATSPQENAGRSELSIDWLDQQAIEPVGPALYRIARTNAGTVRIKYALGLGGWSDRENAPKLISLWHPVYLKKCPTLNEQTFASIWPSASFEIDIEEPKDWKLAAPGEKNGTKWTYRGTSFSAVFYRQGKEERFETGEQTIIAVSQTEGFQQLISYARSAFPRLSKLTGGSPESTFLMVETNDFEPLRTPGLVTLNMPQQPAMRKLQQDFTNWIVWQFTVQIAQQWFGLSCKAASIDDHWLMKGLADMLVYSQLSSEKDFFELFARGSSGKPHLNLNYRQAQDLAAASMSLLHPQSSLMDDKGVSRPSSTDKPFISYIRGTQILRYIQWKLGNSEFQALLRKALLECSNESIGPQHFARLVDQHHPGLSELVMKYWSSDDWPDVSLEGTSVREGKTYLKVKYANDLLLPIDIWITSEDDSKRVVFIEPTSQELEIALEEDEDDIRKIEINPSRALFDKDRFNNKTGAPRIAFFPGAARGLEDDAYTVVWLPYVSQLPGEPFTINLSFQTLRYLNSGVTGMIRYQPQEKRTGFNMHYLKALPEYSLFLLAKIGQDDGHVEDGERRISFDLRRKTLWAALPRLSGSLRAKSKQILGLPDTRHMTVGGTIAYGSESGGHCGHDQELESESTVYVPSKEFNYTRTFARMSFGCESKQIAGRFRLFYGSSKADGHVPVTAFFRAQNLDEAHIRLDNPDLPGSLRVGSFNVELAVPARLPLPESWFILPRRSQFKAFLDGAELKDPDHRVLVSGVGYTLPLGGDIAGKDSVTLVRFTLNGIFYREIDGLVDRKPGVLFDFGGSL